MPDLYADWPSGSGQDESGDLQTGPDGDFAIADGATEARQRVERRCLSIPRRQIAPGVYSQPTVLWDPDFGVGVGELVGGVLSDDVIMEIQRRMRDGMAQDSDVLSLSPPPDAAITPNPGASAGLSIIAQFTPAATGKPVSAPLNNLL